MLNRESHKQENSISRQFKIITHMCFLQPGKEMGVRSFHNLFKNGKGRELFGWVWKCQEVIKLLTSSSSLAKSFIHLKQMHQSMKETYFVLFRSLSTEKFREKTLSIQFQAIRQIILLLCTWQSISKRADVFLVKTAKQNKAKPMNPFPKEMEVMQWSLVCSHS